MGKVEGLGFGFGESEAVVVRAHDRLHEVSD